MRTMWRQHGDHRDVETTWGQCGDNVGTTWGLQGCGDHVGTTWRQYWDNMRTLSLHLNHLIASRTANYDWPFGTFPFGLFCSNLDTRDLETYPRTYSGHF